MKKKINRLDLAALNETFYVLTNKEMSGFVGGGTGSSADPYSLSEYEKLIADGNRRWDGGFVAGLGYVWPDVEVSAVGYSMSYGSYDMSYLTSAWAYADSQLGYVSYADASIRKVFLNEGGYSNNPNDKGGETNFGITKAFMQRYGNQITGGMPSSVTSLTCRQAYELYYACWRDYGMDRVYNGQLATIIFDGIINCGSNGVECVQRALVKLGCSIKVDGYLGDETFSAINSCNGERLFEAIKDERIAYYKSLNNSLYEKGWINRVNSFNYNNN